MPVSPVNAPLIERQMTACARLTRKSEPDGLGGFATRWTRGERFFAAVIPERSDERREAHKEGVRETYTVTTPEGVGLRFHDAFVRERDGAVFRAVTNSRDSRPPGCATFCFEQARAQRWTPPDGAEAADREEA